MEKILFEELMKVMDEPESSSQKKLFPVQVELNQAELAVYRELKPELENIGFEVEEFGGNTVIIHAIPGLLDDQAPEELLESLLEHFKQETLDLKKDLKEKLIKSIAYSSSRISGKELNSEEMQNIIDRLFACNKPEITPTGKKVLTILQTDELEKRFL